jgi:hypothetical protein
MNNIKPSIIVNLMFAASLTNAAAVVFAGAALQFDAYFLGRVLGTFICAILLYNFFSESGAVLCLIVFFILAVNQTKKNLSEEISFQRSEFIIGLGSACANRLNFDEIILRFGNEQGQKLVDHYCKCYAELLGARVDFSRSNTVSSQLKNISEPVLSEIDQRCTKETERIYDK